MEWLAENFMVIVFYVFIIYMVGRIFYQVYLNAKKEKEAAATGELPECTPLITQYVIKDGLVNQKAIKAVFLELCRMNFIKIVPIINNNDDITDYELFKNNVPNFKDEEYENNLFNEDFKDSSINLSYLYILNKYIFFGKEKNLYSSFIKDLNNVNLQDDLLFIKIITAEMFNTNLIESSNSNSDEIDITEKGEEVSKNIEGLKIFLKKYDLEEGYAKEDIDVWGLYLTYGIAYELKDLSIENLNILYSMDYFKNK